MNKHTNRRKYSHKLKGTTIRSKSSSTIDELIFGILLFVMGVIPLIILGSYTNIQPPVISDNYYLKLTARGDFFSYYKAVVLHWSTLLIVILFAVKILFFNGKIKKTILNYFVGGSIAALIISTLLSPAMTIAFYGLPNRAEGSLTWICYLLLFWVAMNIEYPKNIVRIILLTFIPFTFINLIIILIHFYGNNIFAYEWVRTIVGYTLPSNMTVPKSADVVGTLNQWNYMSGMFSLLTIVYITAATFEREKLYSVLYCGLAIITGAISLLSISTGGFLVICMMSFGVFIYAIRYKHIKKFAIIFIIFAISYTSLSIIFGKTEERVYNESIGLITSKLQANSNSTAVPSLPKPIENQPAEQGESTYTLPKLPAPAMSALSGREYIWQKTWESSLKRPILGYGMDTNIYFFPHYNIDARAMFRTETITVGKPHSIYLGFIQGVGLIGSIPIFALMITIVSLIVRPLLKKQNVFPTAAILGAGFIAYLLQGIVNDSVVGISTALWPIAGIMCALFLQEKEYESSIE